ncbi:hypothetical protein GGI26_003294 [Coemansia sp. RSA 1358]|nr:hypothetical protein EDC05_005183 [Coemansia umbellata]KAJ2622431.1 hypothetical protein GGI26_003294 [Coemansia sp. RSA 1358]
MKSMLGKHTDDELETTTNVKRVKAADSLQVFRELQMPIPGVLAQSYTFFSPHQAASEEYVLGVDEAGRGPVLGPMVYSACFCPISAYVHLKSLGFADSKQLSEDQRSKLFARLQTEEHAGWAVRCISPRDISQCMLRRTKYNLNSLAHDATIQLLREINQKANIRQVFIDTVGPPASYQKKLQQLFPSMEITVAKKADSLYPIVSAASVCAKVVRDAHLENWVFAEPLEVSRVFGSGYPGDPNTVRWLRESLDPVFGYPSIIRFSWSTCTKLLEESAVAVVWADEDEKHTKLTSKWFGGASNRRTRSKFFSRRPALILTTSL